MKGAGSMRHDFDDEKDLWDEEDYAEDEEWTEEGDDPEEDGVTVEYLRDRLEDYYGTAMQQFPMAVMDLGRVGHMSDAEIAAEARKIGII